MGGSKSQIVYYLVLTVCNLRGKVKGIIRATYRQELPSPLPASFLIFVVTQMYKTRPQYSLQDNVYFVLVGVCPASHWHRKTYLSECAKLKEFVSNRQDQWML